MVFHWILSDSKSPQVSKTFLTILADLSNVVVWMVSPPSSDFDFFLPPYQAFKDHSKCTNYDITVAFMFHNVFSYQTQYNANSAATKL